MARPRLPQAKAEVSGAALKNPGTFKGRRAPTGTRPIGEPYAQMTPGQQEAWHEMVAEMPWLNSSHRTLLRLACIISARLDGPDVGVNQLQTLSAILSKLGPPRSMRRASPPRPSLPKTPAIAFFGPQT